jgi:glycerate dehydrogenase
MRIIVLDGYTLNPGDLSWDSLKQLASTEIYDRTETSQIVDRTRGAELVLTNKTPLAAETLYQLPGLRYIGVFATGYNCVDVKAAKELGITVTNVPNYGTRSVAQFVFALLLELCHNVGLHNEAVRAGQWSQCNDWCFWRAPLVELHGKNLGVVGFGRIGRQVARIADAMGMRVLASAPRQFDSDRPPVRWASLEELLSQSDVISLHCPLLPETEGLINVKRLELMKTTAFLINTSRGGLIVDQDLAEALNAGQISGAGLDVLSIEPPITSNPLLTAKNCLITPHIAWATKEARTRLLETAVMNVAAFMRGSPKNVVNP